MTGEWPKGHLDHIDGDKSNNRFSNLRQATKMQNGANMKGRASSGYKGVYYDKRDDNWFSTIQANGVRYYLGCFADPALAHQAYIKASKKYNGEFARAK